MTSNKNKAIIFFLFPLVFLSPLGIVFVAIGTFIGIGICGGGSESLQCGFIGGIASSVISVCLLSVTGILLFFKERHLLHKVTLSILLIFYTLLVIFIKSYKGQIYQNLIALFR